MSDKLLLDINTLQRPEIEELPHNIIGIYVRLLCQIFLSMGSRIKKSRAYKILELEQTEFDKIIKLLSSDEFRLLECDSEFVWNVAVAEDKLKLAEKRKLNREKQANHRKRLKSVPRDIPLVMSEREREREREPLVLDLKKGDTRGKITFKPRVSLTEEFYLSMTTKFTKQIVDEEIQKYSDWQLSKGTTHKDNEAGFRNWIQRAMAYKRQAVSKGYQPHTAARTAEENLQYCLGENYGPDDVKELFSSFIDRKEEPKALVDSGGSLVPVVSRPKR